VPASTPASRHRSSMSSAFCLGIVTDCPPYTAVGDRAFPVAAPRIWNSLPQHVTSAPSLVIFRRRLKTHLLKCCFPWVHRSLVVPEKWHVITDTLIVFVTYLPPRGYTKAARTHSPTPHGDNSTHIRQHREKHVNLNNNFKVGPRHRGWALRWLTML